MLEIIAVGIIGIIVGAIAANAQAHRRISDAEQEVIKLAGIANLKEAYQDKAVKLERQLRSACNELDHERDKTSRLQESLNNACRQIEQYQLAEQAIKAPVVKEGRRVRPGKAARAAARKRRAQPSHAVDAAAYQAPAHHGFNTPLIVVDEGDDRVSNKSRNCMSETTSETSLVDPTTMSRRHLGAVDGGVAGAHISDPTDASSATSHVGSSSSYDSSSSSSDSSSSSSCD